MRPRSPAPSRVAISLRGRSALSRAALVALAALILGPSVVASPAGAEPPASILHEFVPPDPNEDISFAATLLEGDLPAAIQTRSGVSTAPDPRKPPGQDHVYSGATTDDGPDSTYEPDRDTRKPNVENYDDPFSPATAPFKRLRAYDSIEPDYSLRVRDKSLKPLLVGGSATANDEAFYGDMSVDLLPDQPVRIPTVGPGARILRVHANPEVQIDVFHDGADNWFVRGAEHVRVRLVMELAIPQATFGSEYADVDWSALDVGQQPKRVAEPAFQQVAQAVGISRGQRPKDVVRKMVAYFRGFNPSDDPPSSQKDIYLDLALSKKGVCRHRAFAFLVTALQIGIPARMVVNEAHAWVEVFDASLWHRIDLGGAAANLDHEPDSGRPPYKPPPDPYAWPEGQESGQDLADRNREQRQGGPGKPAASASAAASAAASAGAAASASASAAASAAASASAQPSSTPEPAAPKGPASEVTVTVIDSDAHRGKPLHLAGRVTAAGAPCPHLRVDVLLSRPAMPQVASIGSLSTDEGGAYDGHVVIPRGFALGDYNLSVATPGDARCAPSR